MGDLLRTIIRWIIVILIVILIIFLLFKITNKSSRAKKAVDTGVDTVENIAKDTKDAVEDIATPEEDTTIEETKAEEVEKEEALVVDSPDTATTSVLGLVGILILSSGTYYIYRSKKATN